MKKYQALFLIFVLFGCTTAKESESQGTYTNQKNEVTTANIKWQDDKIMEIELDETTGDTTKKAKGESYGMKAASTIGKEWNEQAMFLEKYIETNGYEKIEVDEEGKAKNEDILTGCTMSIDGFMKAIDDAKAKKE